jgi:hypothetical protein
MGLFGPKRKELGQISISVDPSTGVTADGLGAFPADALVPLLDALFRTILDDITRDFAKAGLPDDDGLTVFTIAAISSQERALHAMNTPSPLKTVGRWEFTVLTDKKGKISWHPDRVPKSARSAFTIAVAEAAWRRCPAAAQIEHLTKLGAVGEIMLDESVKVTPSPRWETPVTLLHIAIEIPDDLGFELNLQGEASLDAFAAVLETELANVIIDLEGRSGDEAMLGFAAVLSSASFEKAKSLLQAPSPLIVPGTHHFTIQQAGDREFELAPHQEPFYAQCLLVTALAYLGWDMALKEGRDELMTQATRMHIAFMNEFMKDMMKDLA